MKQLPVVLALCVFSATTCIAQSAADQPATKADIDRYYEATHVRENLKAIMDSMTKQIKQMTHDELLKTPNLPPDAEDKMNAATNKMLKDFPLNEMLDAMEPVYEKHFTKGDIDALVSFYSTPVGKKLLTEQPAMAAEAMQASMGIVQKFMSDTTEHVQQDIAQMQKDNAGSSKAEPANN